MQKKLAAAVGGGSEMDVHQLPVLGFGDVRGGRYSGDDEELHRDTLKFPGVPPREVHTPLRHEQWNVDTIDIALEDLVLDKGKTRSMTQSQSSVGQGVGAKARGAAAHSIMDEAQVDEKQYLPAQPRVHTLSDASDALLLLICLYLLCLLCLLRLRLAATGAPPLLRTEVARQAGFNLVSNIL